MKVRFALLAAVAGVALAASAQAAISFTGSYSENFDSMGAGGTSAPTDWTVASLGTNAPAAGGSGQPMTVKPTLTVDNGSYGGSPNGTATSGGNSFNYGTTGASDRALGNMPTTSYGGAMVMQAAFTNATGASIGALTIGYTGEQWRFNQSSSSTGLEGIILYYSTDATTGFTAVSLDFVAPQQTDTQSGLSRYQFLDGNAAANRVVLSKTYTLPAALPSGSAFYLRWFDQNDSGTTDHGLAIDNVTISTVPEPATLSLLGLAALPLIRRRRA